MQLLTDQLRRRLVARREYLGMSRALLARKLVYTPVEYIEEMEAGRLAISYQELCRWASALGMRVWVEVEEVE